MSGRQTRSKSNSPQGGDLTAARRSPRTNLRTSPYPSPSSSSRTSPSPSALELAEAWQENGLASLGLSPAAASKQGPGRNGQLPHSSPGLDNIYSDGSTSVTLSAPSPEAKSPLSSPPTSSTARSQSPPPSRSPSPSPAPSSQVTRRVTRSCAGDVELDPFQDNLPSCSRKASPRSKDMEPPEDEPERLEWTKEVEKVKSILPHLPSNPQPWRALDPGLVKHIMLCEEVRAGRERPGGRPSKLAEGPTLVPASLSPRLRRQYGAVPFPITTH